MPFDLFERNSEKGEKLERFWFLGLLIGCSLRRFGVFDKIGSSFCEEGLEENSWEAEFLEEFICELIKSKKN